MREGREGATPQFDVRIVVVPDGSRRVVVRGDIDIRAAPELRTTLERAVAEDHEIHVDVAGLRTIDSTGISELLRARELALRLGKAYALINPPDDVRRLFRMLDITDLFDTLRPR
jgi:anti-sigma B factor antagonist